MNVMHHKTVADFFSYVEKDKRHIVAVDIIPGAKPISSVKLPKKTVLVFGGEGPGLSEEMRNAAEETVMIEQFGSTRSVNVGVAAGIAMYVWMQQNVFSE
jgi:tRNA G18 (ribose-2'-O)-methylase SpoU